MPEIPDYSVEPGEHYATISQTQEDNYCWIPLLWASKIVEFPEAGSSRLAGKEMKRLQALE